MEQRTIDDRNERLTAFTADYKAAWEASGQPSRWQTAELFVDVLGHDEAQHDVALHPLMVFFRASLQRNEIPLNWYGKEGLDALFPPKPQSVFRVRFGRLFMP